MHTLIFNFLRKESLTCGAWCLLLLGHSSPCSLYLAPLHTGPIIWCPQAGPSGPSKHCVPGKDTPQYPFPLRAQYVVFPDKTPSLSIFTHHQVYGLFPGKTLRLSLFTQCPVYVLFPGKTPRLSLFTQYPGCVLFLGKTPKLSLFTWCTGCVVFQDSLLTGTTQDPVVHSTIIIIQDYFQLWSSDSNVWKEETTFIATNLNCFQTVYNWVPGNSWEALQNAGWPVLGKYVISLGLWVLTVVVIGSWVFMFAF